MLPNALIVVERREFVRGCLTCWLAKYCSEIRSVAVADVESDLPADALSAAVGAIVGIGSSEHPEWLRRQVGWLRARHAVLPIMLMVEPEQGMAAASLAVELDLQGYIPGSSSLEVAAAAVHLVMAGGSYFPRPQSIEPRQKELLSGYENPTVDSARMADLTSRERAVLELLGSGMPNKVIAHRLGMSLSTVKAHVHHIIRKLGVGNRTEVALLAQHMPFDVAEAAKLNDSSAILAPDSGAYPNIRYSSASLDRRAEDMS